MSFDGKPIHLTDAQRSDLEEVTRSCALSAEFVQRAKVVLLLADGVSGRTVATKFDVSRPTIAKGRRRFLEDGVEGLTSRYPGARTMEVVTPRVRARVLAATRRLPLDGTTHWSCRRLAAHLGVSKKHCPASLARGRAAAASAGALHGVNVLSTNSLHGRCPVIAVNLPIGFAILKRPLGLPPEFVERAEHAGHPTVVDLRLVAASRTASRFGFCQPFSDPFGPARTTV